MIQSLLMTGLTPLCETNEINCWQNRPFTTVWPEPHRQLKSKGEQITKTIKKKTKRVRTAYTTEQIRGLEKTFGRSRYIDMETRKELSDLLKISEKSIKIWFQNRRMKEKKDSESSCNSSLESVSNAASPAIQNCHEFIPKEACNYQFRADHSLLPDAYQFPNLSYNGYGSDYQIQIGTPTTVPSDYDINVYPTQYYPNTGTGTYYSSDVNQFAQYDNFWPANTFDLNYF